MNMKSKILPILAMAAMAAPSPPIERSLFNEPPNGNSKRNHKQNIKRKKMRRLKNKARQQSRK